MDSRQILSSGLCGALLALGGCALQAQTDHDARYSVAGCHTYAFSDQQSGAAPSSAAFDNPVNAQRLREAIASGLAARNMTPVAEGASADCLVSYALGSRLSSDSLGANYEWGYGAPPPLGWGGRYYGAGVAWGAPYTYREGRVTVDLYDAHSHQALWHAFVDTDVTELKGAEADQRIKEAVAAIFDKFPIAGPGAAISKS